MLRLDIDLLDLRSIIIILEGGSSKPTMSSSHKGWESPVACPF